MEFLKENTREKMYTLYLFWSLQQSHRSSVSACFYIVLLLDESRIKEEFEWSLFKGNFYALSIRPECLSSLSDFSLFILFP